MTVFDKALCILLGVGLLIVLVLWGALWGLDVFAAEPAAAAPLVEEAERDGVDALYAALAAAVTALVGWVVKSPRDYLRERRAAQNGTEGGVDGRMDIAQVALDTIRGHEIACEEHRREQRAESEKLHTRISECNKGVAAVQSDVSYIRGLLEARRNPA